MRAKYFQLITFLILLNILNFSQSLGIDSYLYISPAPGSSFHLPQTSIIMRQGEVIDDSKLESIMITVSGTRSGIHRGEFFLSSDLKTLIFKPFIAFSLGEVVSVKLNEHIKTVSGNMLQPFEFSFGVTGSVCDETKQCYEDQVINRQVTSKNIELSKSNHALLNYRKNLPENFPPFEVNILNNPSFGYIFLAPYSVGSSITGYIMILDNDAIPIYYQRSTSVKLDFKLQYNRLLTYWDHIP